MHVRYIKITLSWSVKFGSMIPARLNFCHGSMKIKVISKNRKVMKYWENLHIDKGQNDEDPVWREAASLSSLWPYPMLARSIHCQTSSCSWQDDDISFRLVRSCPKMLKRRCDWFACVTKFWWLKLCCDWSIVSQNVDVLILMSHTILSCL